MEDSPAEHAPTAAVEPPASDIDTAVEPATTSAGHASSTEQAPPSEDTAKISREPKMKKIAAKAKRARYLLAVIVSCLAFLVVALFTIVIGLQGIQGIFAPQLREAERLFWATQSQYHQEQFLQERLSSLLQSSLERRSFETHPHCLARGMTLADAHYFDLPYEHYPDILRPTMDWVEDNCGKLLFTPQIPEPTAQALLKVGWTKITTNAERFYLYLKQHGIFAKRWLETKWLGRAPVQEQPSKLSKVFDDEFTDYLWMPVDFKLVCNDRCHLEYSPIRPHGTVTATVSEQAITQAKRRVAGLTITTLSIFKVMRFISLVLVWLLVPLEMASLLALIFVIWKGPLPRQSVTITVGGIYKEVAELTAKIRHEEKEVVGILAMQVFLLAAQQLVLLCQTILQRLPDTTYVPLDCCLTGLLVLGCGMLSVFLLPFPVSNQVENIYFLVEAAMNLYKALREEVNVDVAAKPIDQAEAKTDSVSEHFTLVDGDSPSIDTPSASSQDGSPTRRRFSPTSSLQEDMDLERQAIHEERLSELLKNYPDHFPPEDAEPAEMQDIDLKSNLSEVGSDWSVI